MVTLNYINFGDDDLGDGIYITFAPEGIARLVAGYEDEHKRSEMIVAALHLAYEQGKRKEHTGDGRNDKREG